MNYPSTKKFIAARAGYEAAQKLSVINTRVLCKLSDLQMDIADIGVEAGIAQVQLLSNIENRDGRCNHNSQGYELHKQEGNTGKKSRNKKFCQTTVRDQTSISKVDCG